MYLRRFYDEGLAHASYLVGCQASGEAIVIDPARDTAPYHEDARDQGLNITGVTETHIHADYLSGTRQLAQETGARMYLSGEGGEDWSYQFASPRDTIVRDGDLIEIGKLTLKVLHTPGHTPEHLSFLLTDHPASEQPIGIFTGDFVFVGDVGRPDLLEKAAGVAGTMEAGARRLFQSLKRISQLPDHLQIWPAHGAGSACGKGLGSVPSSVLGYEKMVNWAFRITDQEEFVREVLAGQPEAPKYFAEMKRANKVGPDTLWSTCGAWRLSPPDTCRARSSCPPASHWSPGPDGCYRTRSRSLCC
jgi:hydroxyacylglutathione hydrolase